MHRQLRIPQKSMCFIKYLISHIRTTIVQNYNRFSTGKLQNKLNIMTGKKTQSNAKHKETFTNT